MIHRLREITKGLYRGSAPTPKDVVMLKKFLGINKIVSLDRAAGERIDRICKLLGIEHVKLYVEGKKSLAKLLQHDLRKLLLEGGPTFFHCHYGKDRTGLLAALFKCKYMGVNPEDALQEAYSLGFGVGVPDNVLKLYEELIRTCQPVQDENNLDIVSLEREYVGDNRDTFLDESRQDSFAPFLDHTKQAPIDSLYNYIMEQSPTRQDYDSYRRNKKRLDEEEVEGEEVPLVGIYNNDAQILGLGPSSWSGGFISD